MNRRNFLKSAGALSGLGLTSESATAFPSRPPSVYAELGVKPFINAAGTYTMLSACVMPKEVLDAMHDAASTHVSIPELQKAFSDHVAPMLGCEAALVTAGCASALSVSTAACVTGKDPERIRRIPDTTG